MYTTAILGKRVPGLSYEKGKRQGGAMVTGVELDFHWEMVQLCADLLLKSTA